MTTITDTEAHSIAVEHAADHFRRDGYDVVETNATTAQGTVDVIARGGGALVFARVALADGPDTFGAAIALGSEPHATRSVRRSAAAWLADTTDRPTVAEVRYDALGVSVGAAGELCAVAHLKGAF